MGLGFLNTWCSTSRYDKLHANGLFIYLFKISFYFIYFNYIKKLRIFFKYIDI